jgi:hypothetical protein
MPFILQLIPEEILRRSELEVRAQSGSNRYASQKAMVSMGTGRDVVRESHPHCENLKVSAPVIFLH